MVRGDTDCMCAGILLMVLFGFSMSFLLLFSTGPGSYRPSSTSNDVMGQQTFAMSWLSGFGMMLGEYDPDSFRSTTSEAAMIVLFMVFVYLVTIVLLNLLIAIMGDKYDEVLENGRAEYQFARACMILEYEDLMSNEVHQYIRYDPSVLLTICCVCLLCCRRG